MSASSLSTHATSDELVIRGELAARAVRIDLVGPPVDAGPGAALSGSAVSSGGLRPTGPWAVDMTAALDEARAEGFEAGHHDGRSTGWAEGLAEGRAESAHLAAMVEQLADHVERQVEDLGQRLAREVTELALTIAEAVIGRELRCTEDLGAEAIARCLELVPATGTLVARLNPEDLEALGPIAGLGDRDLTVVADPDMARGDAVVEVDDTVIDGRLSLAIERVAQVLS